MTNQLYCTAPWNGITVRENGNVLTCCMGSTVLGNINSQPIHKIYNNSKHIQIKQEMLDGTPSKNCINCVNFEKNNANVTASIRSYYNTTYSNLADELKFLDIRWNNLCNLSCIYCGPYFSSSWAEKLSPNNIKIIKNDYDSDLEDWILSKVDQLHELMLVGGEPLLMKQNYKLIDKLSDTTRLSIITNLSYNLSNNQSTQKLFNRPKDNTIWNVSVENYGQQFEYVRNGANWQQFSDNLKLLMANNPNNVNLQMVYGVFSALSLFDTVKYYYNNFDIKKTKPNLIDGNPILSLFRYPNSILKLAIKQLEDIIAWQKETFGIDYELYKSDDFETILDKLNETVYNNVSREIITKDEFIKGIASYDKWTKHKFFDLWVDEYKQIIESLE